MHILQVTPYYPPAYAYGGIPRIVAGLSETLSVLGAQVSVLTTDVFDATQRLQRPPQQRCNGVDVYRLPNLSNRLAFHQQLFLPLMRQHDLDQIAHHSPIDIIHLHGHRHLLNNQVLAWAKRHNVPYVFTANGTLRRHEQKEWIKIGWDHWISGHVPFEANACVAVSDADRQIHAEWGIPQEKIHTIPNGLYVDELTKPIPSRLREALNIPSNQPVIAYLGRISPRKGVDVLVQAFQKLTVDAALIIAGSDMGGLAKARSLANNHPRIYFLDTIDGDDRLDLLQHSDIIAYPSEKEIFGLVPFEALLAGTPTIVSDDCGCGEIITKANAGLLVPYGDVTRLTESISILLRDSSTGREMVHRGRQYIQRYLAWDIIAKQHLDLYKQIILG